jgi:hypothetical protein
VVLNTGKPFLNKPTSKDHSKLTRAVYSDRSFASSKHNEQISFYTFFILTALTTAQTETVTGVLIDRCATENELVVFASFLKELRMAPNLILMKIQNSSSLQALIL